MCTKQSIDYWLFSIINFGEMAPNYVSWNANSEGVGCHLLL